MSGLDLMVPVKGGLDYEEKDLCNIPDLDLYNSVEL